MVLVGAARRARIKRHVQLLRYNRILRSLSGFVLWLSFIYLGDRLIDENPDAFSSLRHSTITVDETIHHLENFLAQLQFRMRGQKSGRTTFHNIWKIYHDLAVQMLLPWDQTVRIHRRMPKRRDDGSIFLSIASYRDENCMSTLHQAYANAKYPDRLFVGLVQQNCVENCVGGMDSNFETKPVAPDPDCHRLFCESALGKPHCLAGRVRVLHVAESESLGPYVARYFASKLWHGESWFVQIDAHMTFAERWDERSIGMLRRAPSEKPILSHYPVDASVNLEESKGELAPRICVALFSAQEFGIIRLDGNRRLVDDGRNSDIPRFTPFVAAGYFVAHSDFLREVPFDPLYPWLFTGEEILLSARLWTHGYDLFAPTHSVVGHVYYRWNKPKFWESMGRRYWHGVHAPLQNLVLQRVKHLLRYPECARDLILPKSLLTSIDQYGMGANRTIREYLELTGIDPARKQISRKRTEWCERGQPPNNHSPS